MARLRISNNYETTLSTNITETDTTLVVSSLINAPKIDVAGDFFYLTLVDTTGNIEIVKVTSVDVDNRILTVDRGQDDTVALPFPTDTKVSCRPNKASMYYYQESWFTRTKVVPTRVDDKNFTVPTDVTDSFQVGRAIRFLNDTTSLDGYIDASVYSDPVTTITIGAGVLPDPLSVIELGPDVSWLPRKQNAAIADRALTADDAEAHIADLNNPHAVSTSQIGAAKEVDLEAHVTDKSDPHDTLPDGGSAGETLIVQEDGSLAWSTIAGVPVGQLCWSSNGVALPGTVAVNVKQKFLLGVYPQLEEWAKKGNYLTDEAVWDAEAAAQDGSCGRYCITDTHIILPCVRHYVGAARPGEVGKEVGDWAGDAIRNITGALEGVDGGLGETYPWGFKPGVHGAISVEQTSTRYNSTDGSIYTAAYGTSAIFDASSVVPTADENRPKTLYHLPCIKVADVAINAAQVDLMAIADQVAEINGSKADRTELAQIGVGQTWQDMTAERDVGVVYTNTTGKPIEIHIRNNGVSGGGGSTYISINGSPSFRLSSGWGAGVCGSIIIPNGNTYEITSATGGLDIWYELR